MTTTHALPFSLPCVQGRAGVGCFGLRAGAWLPPPHLPLQAGGEAYAVEFAS